MKVVIAFAKAQNPIAMKRFFTLLLITIVAASCQTVRVTQDYDVNADFNKYQTYAYYKQGIDEADVSELDKKRILRAIDANMQAKGFTKSQNPDFMINIFTDAKERVDVYNNWGWNVGWGWGWGGFWGGPWGNSVNRVTEGVLYIDFIDTSKKELIWQGIGTAPLKTTPQDKIARTNEMVKEILEQFPPEPAR